MFVRISHHPCHPGQGGQFFRRALRVTSSDQNAATRIVPLQAPDRSARVLIRAFGYRASVEYDDLGVTRGAGAVHSTIEELAFQRGAVGLGGAATKILYVETCHASILNQ